MIKEDVRMKKWAPRVLLAAALAGLSAFLLKGDVWTFWTWWLLAFLMGMVAMPVTGRLFAGFEDKGWMFSKVLAITVTGFLTWFLVTAKILPFTAATCIGPLATSYQPQRCLPQTTCQPSFGVPLLSQDLSSNRYRLPRSGTRISSVN